MEGGVRSFHEIFKGALYPPGRLRTNAIPRGGGGVTHKNKSSGATCFRLWRYQPGNAKLQAVGLGEVSRVPHTTAPSPFSVTPAFPLPADAPRAVPPHICGLRRRVMLGGDLQRGSGAGGGVWRKVPPIRL